MARNKDVLQRVRPLLGLADREEFIGVAVGNDSEPIACECARRGPARMWLFRKHIGLEFDEGHQAQAIAIDTVWRVTRSRRAYMQKNSFAVPPLCHVVVKISTDPPHDDTVILVFSDRTVGNRCGRAIEFLWRHYNNDLSEREAMHLSCNRFVDVVTVAAHLPIKEACALALPRGPSAGTLVISEEGVVEFTHASNNEKQSWRVDDVLMLRRSRGVAGVRGDHLLLMVAAGGGRTEDVRFTKFASLDDIEKAAQRVWCLACNSDVNFRIANEHVPQGFCASPYRKRRESICFEKVREFEDKVCFPLNDVLLLLQTFQVIDADSSGMLSRWEWIDSLGPLFRRSKVPDIVFGVFDHNGDDMISFPEFLFGCRILHLGSPEDRQVYQFRIFDPKSVGHIDLETFTSVVMSLDEISNIRRPEGQTVRQWCERMFRQMDCNDDGTVDMEDFRHSVTTNEEFMTAFSYLATTRRHQRQTQKVTGRLVWFGDPQWLTSTAILMGCNLATERRKRILEERGHAPRKSSSFPQAFQEVCTWELGTGSLLNDKERAKKKPLLTSDGHTTRRDAPPLVRWESYFSDHCPQVFLALQIHFGADPDKYLLSLGLDQLESSMLVGSLSSLCTMSSSGRSGAFFFASHDGRYILKTIPADEGDVLKEVLPAYYDHMIENPDTLLTRYYGLHTLQYGDKKVTFLVMENVMQQEREVSVIYDLKGSKVGRTTPLEQRKPGYALKDLDFRRSIDVPRDLRDKFMAQVRADTDMLMRQNLNDYSFLVGIHTSPTPLPPPTDDMDGTRGSDTYQRPLFRRHYGGFPSRDGREVFYAGVIDILTYYGLKKRGEHGFKSILHKSYEVSCVPPEIYRERFVRYIESIFEVSHHTTGAGGGWYPSKPKSPKDSSLSLRRKLSSKLGIDSHSAQPSQGSPKYIDPVSGFAVPK